MKIQIKEGYELIGNAGMRPYRHVDIEISTVEMDFIQVTDERTYAKIMETVEDALKETRK